jgi:hypothetical protein
MPPASAVANKQCDTGPGFYGKGVEVLTIDLFDGTHERGEKRGSCVSLTSPPLPLTAPLPLTPDPKEGEAHKWPGDAKPFFRATNAAIRAHLARGNAVVVHCMASLSRSICFICAYLMECERLTLLQVPPPLPAHPLLIYC